MLNVNWHLEVRIWDEDNEEYINHIPDDVAEKIAADIVNDFVDGMFDINCEV